MKKREKLIITAETCQRTTIRWRRNPMVAWCDECAAKAQMLAPNEAAAILPTTALAIFRGVEAGDLHFIETASGALFVCRNSLESGQPIEKGVSHAFHQNKRVTF